MTVHNIAEYVKYHQEKLRQQQQPQQTAQSSSSTSQNSRRGGVNQIHSKSSFQTSVIEASNDKIVVIDYFATWCGPCKAISPVIAKWAESDEYAGKVDFVKIDVDEVPDVAQEQAIRAMPTFAIFKNGQKVNEVVGANPQAVKAAIDRAL